MIAVFLEHSKINVHYPGEGEIWKVGNTLLGKGLEYVGRRSIPRSHIKDKQTKNPALCGGEHLLPGGGEVETGRSLGLRDCPV